MEGYRCKVFIELTIEWGRSLSEIYVHIHNKRGKHTLEHEEGRPGVGSGTENLKTAGEENRERGIKFARLKNNRLSAEVCKVHDLSPTSLQPSGICGEK